MVEDQRTSANTYIEAGGPRAEERTPTKRCICNTCGNQIQRLTSLSRGEAGVTPVGRRTDRLRLRRKCKAHQNERDEKEPAP